MLAAETRTVDWSKLEVMEDRKLLAVTIVEAGNTMTLTGDATKNVIEINDDGTQNDPGNITIFADGVLTQSTNDIREIVVNTLAGDDFVSYRLINNDSAISALRKVVVDLGAGADEFVADINRDINTLSDFRFFVDGRTENDLIRLEMAGGAGDVNNDAVLFFQFQTQEGDDTFDLNYDGDVFGILDIRVDSGAGADNLIGSLELEGADATTQMLADIRTGLGNDFVDLRARLFGGVAGTTVDFLVDGGDGNDNLEVAARAFNPTVTGTATIDVLAAGGDDLVELRTANRTGATYAFVAAADGGVGGNDTAFTTANVVTTNFENDTKVAG